VQRRVGIFAEMMTSENRETGLPVLDDDASGFRSYGGMPASPKKIPGDSQEMTPKPNRIASKTYGTVSAERRKAMSGLEFVQGLADGTLPLNTIAQTLGYDITEVVSGRVVVTAEPSGIHLNPAGTVHGGFAATLLDSCMGLAVQSTLERGVSQTTLEFKISLVRPITPETGEIRAEGVVLNRGRRVGTAEGRITDRAGRLLAHGTTTCLVFEN
jgi:uncharacterized protein (TIGR00369 family)